MSFKVNLNNILYSRYTTALTAGMLLVAALTFKSVFTSGSLYEQGLQLYAELLGTTSASLVNRAGYEASYSLTNDSLTVNGLEKLSIQRNLAVKYYVYIAFILLPFANNKASSFALTIAAFAVLFVISVLRNIGIVLTTDHNSHIIISLTYTARYLLIWLALMYRIQSHSSAKAVMAAADLRFRQHFQLSLPLALLMLLTATSWMSLIDRALVYPDSSFVRLLSTIILGITAWILHVLNYQPIISEYYIWIGQVWVYLGSPCLGVGVMTLFVALIAFIRSNILNKLLFIAAGVGWMLLMNSARIAYILIHLYKNGKYTLSMEVHDLSNYFFYAMVFLLLLLYSFWFKDISITLNKTDKHGS